jgi:hypothetical protein
MVGNLNFDMGKSTEKTLLLTHQIALSRSFGLLINWTLRRNGPCMDVAESSAPDALCRHEGGRDWWAKWQTWVRAPTRLVLCIKLTHSCILPGTGIWFCRRSTLVFDFCKGSIFLFLFLVLGATAQVGVVGCASCTKVPNPVALLLRRQQSCIKSSICLSFSSYLRDVSRVFFPGRTYDPGIRLFIDTPFCHLYNYVKTKNYIFSRWMNVSTSRPKICMNLKI